MYPIQYEADYERNPNRLTTFFRLIVAIPWLIVGIVYGIAATVTVLIGWIALIILGRYPEGLYNLNSGFVRYGVRLYGFISMLTDQLPPFGLADDPAYPIRLTVPPPPEKQSRLKVFFRFILAIPLFVLSYPMSILHNMAAGVNWLVIVFRGYTPAGAYNALYFTSAWNARVTSYLVYLTDDYPPAGDEAGQPGDRELQAAATAPSIGGQATQAAPAVPPTDPGQPPAGS